MKQIEIKQFDDAVVVYDKLIDDGAEVDVECGFIRIADKDQCILISTHRLERIAVVPQVADDPCKKCCGDGCCGKECACHDDEKFDCKGACKNRCYECAQQDKIIKGED
jgi:hypothetical protein